MDFQRGLMLKRLVFFQKTQAGKIMAVKEVRGNKVDLAWL